MMQCSASLPTALQASLSESHLNSYTPTPEGNLPCSTCPSSGGPSAGSAVNIRFDQLLQESRVGFHRTHLRTLLARCRRQRSLEYHKGTALAQHGILFRTGGARCDLGSLAEASGRTWILLRQTANCTCHIPVALPCSHSSCTLGAARMRGSRAGSYRGTPPPG
jgi:hypothetical protein